MSFDELSRRWSWQPITNCPGQYVLRGAGADLSPLELLGCEAKIQEFRTPRAADPVLVVVCEGGGLISYRRPGGAYCHTLNTTEGLTRKMDQLQLRLEPD